MSFILYIPVLKNLQIQVVNDVDQKQFVFFRRTRTFLVLDVLLLNLLKKKQNKKRSPTKKNQTVVFNPCHFDHQKHSNESLSLFEKKL